MNLTAEETVKRELELLESPDRIRVRIPVSWKGPFCLPDSDSEDIEEAVFSTLTFGDNFVIEKACTTRVEMDFGPKRMERDSNEMRRLLAKRNLLSWSLPIPIERENGWITNESWERVGSIPGPLMDAFLNDFEERCAISSDEDMEMSRQASVLFSKNSQGVADAMEAVSLFCTYGNFSEKFGIDREALWGLPYREFVMLKLMMGKESNAIRNQARANKAKANTKIVAGHGGKPRASRGISIPG